MSRRRAIPYEHFIAVPSITWPLGTPLLPSDQMVLAIMVDRWGRGDGTIQIGRALLVAESGYSERTIDSAIARLLKAELLDYATPSGRTMKGQARQPTTYRLGRLTRERIAADEAKIAAKTEAKTKGRRQASTGATAAPVDASITTDEPGRDRRNSCAGDQPAAAATTGATAAPVDDDDRRNAPAQRTGATIAPRSYKSGGAEPMPPTAPPVTASEPCGAEGAEGAAQTAASPPADAPGSPRIKPPVFAFADEKRAWLETAEGRAYTAQRAAADNVVPFPARAGGSA